jgi:mercuric ion binding protein
MKSYILSILMFGLVLTSNASQAEDVHVTVKGMVCAYCSTGVEKVFKKQEAVKDIKVNMDEKIVSISFKEGKTMDDKLITSLITDSGFNVAEIKRNK